MSTTPTPAEDQGRLLEEALGVVRQQSHMMRKCLETPGKLMDALKCAYVLYSAHASMQPRQPLFHHFHGCLFLSLSDFTNLSIG